MTREQGQFDEGFAVQKVPATPAPAPPVVADPGAPLSAAALGALRCRITAVRIGTGEEIVVVLSAEDWQGLMDDYHLQIRTTHAGGDR